MGAKRDLQLELFERCLLAGEDEVLGLFNDLYGLSPAKFEVMQRLGLALALDPLAVPPCAQEADARPVA